VPQSDKVDLHLHSTESDGRLSPAELVALAERNGVRRMALTDHDTTDGLPAAIEQAASLGIEVIAGIELSTDIPGTELHMLGHFLEFDDPAFQRTLAEFRAGRIGRARGMVEKLAELGAPIAWDRVQELAGEGSVGRPHVAQALLEAGHIQTIPEAFDRYIGRNGPAYVERSKLTPAGSIELIHSVKGMAVLAHPLEDGGLLHLIPELAEAGLDGVECYYQGYNPARVEQLVSAARAHGLVPTGGSDFHGFPMSGMVEVKNEPGSVEIPPGLVDELLDRKKRLFG
jgi:predicted metal-dependent phosphoesterase TrpH